MTFPSVCWAARPKMTAVNAPPTAMVAGRRPAIRSATSSVRMMVSSRMRKPTVPAVAGSMRRNMAGPNAPPMARAKPQPRARRTMTVPIRMGMSKPLPKSCSR
jgi:hypothetical protein